MKKSLLIKFISITFTALFLIACDNFPGSKPEKEADCIKKDASELDLALCLSYSKTKDEYSAKKSINQFFTDYEPIKDDQLEVTIKCELSDIPKTVKGKLIFMDSIGETVESEAVALNVNSKKVSGTIKGKVPFDFRNISFEITATLDEEEKGSTMLLAENGKGYPSQGRLFSIQPDEKGVKITIADYVTLQAFGGGSIAVKDNPFKISINEGNNAIKEYIFPFTQKGQKVYIQFADNLNTDFSESFAWQSEILSCNAGGGIDITKDFDYESLKKSQIEISFDPLIGFTGVYKITNPKIIKSQSLADEFVSAEIVFNLILGEQDWSKTTFWAQTGFISFLDESLKTTNNFYSSRFPTKEQWESMDNKYSAYATPQFRLKNYPNTRFELYNGSIWSKEKIYIEHQ